MAGHKRATRNVPARSPPDADRLRAPDDPAGAEHRLVDYPRALGLHRDADRHHHADRRGRLRPGAPRPKPAGAHGPLAVRRLFGDRRDLVAGGTPKPRHHLPRLCGGQRQLRPLHQQERQPRPMRLHGVRLAHRPDAGTRRPQAPRILAALDRCAADRGPAQPVRQNGDDRRLRRILPRADGARSGRADRHDRHAGVPRRLAVPFQSSL